MIDERLKALKCGEYAWNRARRLRRLWVVNDLVAVGLLAVGLAGFGLGVVTLFFWSGWVLLAVLLPVAWFCSRWAIPTWLGRNGTRAAARKVEERFPEISGKLSAALELARYRPESREGYSLELVDAAVGETEQILRALDLQHGLDRIVPRRRLGLMGLAALAGVGCVLLYFWAAPARARVGLANALGTTAPVEFLVQPGDTAVLPGAKVEFRCQVKPAGVFRQAWFEKVAPGSERRVVRLDGGAGLVSLTPEGDLRYRFRVLSWRSSEHLVNVVEPLVVSRVSFACRYPSYSGLPEYRFTVEGSRAPDIGALRGTGVEFDGEANGLLAGGRLVFGADTLELETEGRRFRGRFVVTRDGEGMIQLAGARGDFQNGLGLLVRVIADEAPFVKLFLPGRNVDLPMEMRVALGVNSLDDFGLGSLFLHYGRDSVTEKLRLASLAGRREDTTYYVWDLSRSGLLPGDELSYYAAASDNDAVSGPKLGRSEIYKVRFPTMAEIYNASVRQTERTTEELAPLQEQQAEIGAELERIGEELRREGKLSWEEKKALEQVLSSQQQLSQEVARLAEEVKQLTDELFSGLTLDQETVERLGQLQELLSRLLPQEVQQSLERLRESLEGDRPDLKEALAKFQLDQEQLKASIDRALEFLEKVMEEQKLEALARMAAELEKMQQDILGQVGSQEPSKLSELEKELGRSLDSLLKDLDSLARAISDSGVGDSLSEVGAQARSDSLSKLAQSTEQSFRQGDRQQGKSSGKRLAAGLGRMAQSLESLNQKLKRDRTAQVVERLLAAAEELVAISKQEEELERLVRQNSGVPERAARQMSLHDASGIVAESLLAMGGKTMVVTGRLTQELFRARQAMKDAAQAMVENRGTAARSQMARARSGLDRTVQSVLAALESAEGCCGMSGSMEDLLEQLSQMTAEQMAINSGMSGIPIPIPGGLSEAQMQALGRLLSRQRALRERLQELLQSMGGERPGLTSSLDNLLEEMEAVERDMSELAVTRELVQRQESILSHLLDAQRSVQQRGHKEERESEAAKPYELGPKPSLPQDRGERNRLLREELMRALKRGGFGEYQPMIRAYFERLLSRPAETEQ